MAAAQPSSPSLDFGFGFNDVNFSDRIMRIEILPETDRDDSLDSFPQNRKGGRVDSLSNANGNQEEVVESAVGAEMAVDQPSDEVANDNEPSSSAMEYPGVQVRILHINSLILAGTSPFFHKLFTNGMRESQQQQRHVTLQIQASEEDAVIDMLTFMYSNTLPRTTRTALLDVLMVADKFDVESCMRYCTQLLLTLPMTCESALLYLDLPSTVSMANTVQKLRDAAKKFLVDQFKDLSKCQEEVLNLPLAGIEAVLSSDDLHVHSEKFIYEFTLKWARLHYPTLEERREILSKHILHLVRFPFMDLKSLKKVLTCDEIESQVATKIVLDALSFKVEPPYRRRSLAAAEANPNASFRQFVARSYLYQPVNVVELELPRQKCIAFVDFKREECAQMFPSGKIFSKGFHLGEQLFILGGLCGMDTTQLRRWFWLYLFGWSKAEFTVDYEFAAIMKPSEDFVSRKRGNNTFMGGDVWRQHHIFSVPWTDLMAEDSPYFINGILHLKVEITLK